MVLALISVVAIGGLSLSLFSIGFAATREQSGRLDDVRALHLAEAAMKEAMVALRTGGTGSVGSQFTPAYFAGGLLWVDATDLGNNQVLLSAAGMHGSGRHSLRAVVSVIPQVGRTFTRNITAKDRISFRPGNSFDSYDSTLGTYEDQPKQTYMGWSYINDNASFQLNESINLNSNMAIFGDVVPGPGESVSYGGSVYISGSTVPATELVEFEPIVVPSFASQGTLSVPAGGTHTITAGDYHYDDITVNSAAQLRIEGPATLVLDAFDLDSSDLYIDGTNGPVVIYLTNDDVNIGGTFTNKRKLPPDLAFICTTDGRLQFDVDGPIHGSIYAPEAVLRINPSGPDPDMYGAAAGWQVWFAAGSSVHLDEALISSGGTPGGGVEVEMLSTYTADFPVMQFMRDRGDPFLLLGVDRAALPRPAQAHDI